MAKIPQGAIDYLGQNPGLWRQFRDKYGSLPDGFETPDAPAAALDYLNQNPHDLPAFEDKYGYNPDERAARRAGAPTPEQQLAEQQAASTQPPKPASYSLPDILSAGYDSFKQNGLKGVRDYLMQRTRDDPEGVAKFNQWARNGSEGALGDARVLTMRSIARLGSSLATIPELVDRYLGDDASADMYGNVRKRYQDVEEAFMQALRPDVRASVEQSFVQKAEDGGYHFGEGASDPWWWTGMAIDTGVQMAPAIGTGGATASAAYGGAYAQALARAAAAKASTKVALRYAEKEATKAAVRAAAIAGSTAEGLTAGGQSAQDVQKSLGEVDEATLMNYEPYRQLREQGLSHEAARAKVADSQALKAGLAVAIATGLTGEPMNAFLGKWIARVPGATGMVAVPFKAAAGEAATEGVQEGSQQLIENVAKTPITGQDPWEGVVENAITGAVAGGVFGGVVGGGAELMQHGQKEGPRTSNDRVLQSKLKKYEAASDNLVNALGSAADPNVNITQDDVNAAREEHRAASVELGQALLDSGKLSKEDQASVAQAIEEARKLGVPVPEGSTNVDEKQLSKPDEAGPGQVAQAEAKPQGEGSAGPAAEPKPALNPTQQGRLELLNKVANAEPVTSEELNTLLKEKLANQTPKGTPVLLPAGRRQRADLTKIVTESEKAKIEQKAKEPTASKPVTEPAKDLTKEATGYSEKEVAAPNTKEPVKEPAQEPAQKTTVQDLSADDYGTLERIATGKDVDMKAVKPLIDAGLVASREGRTPAIRPAGRRELKAFKETRQTAYERGFEPVVEGKTLTLPKPVKLKKRVDQAVAKGEAAIEKMASLKSAKEYQRGERATLAETQRAAQTRAEKEAAFKKAEREAARAKEAQVEEAHQNQADERVATEAASAKEPAGAMAEALANAQQMKQKQKAAPKPVPPLQAAPLGQGPAVAFSKNKKLTFRHFSNLNEKEVTLDPKYQGTGIPGLERRRGGIKVISLYAGDHPDTQVEPGLRGKTEYSVEMAAKDIYDANDDPKGFIAEASSGGNFDMSEFESLVKSAGYKGYYTPQAEGLLKGQARLFGPTKARRKTPVAHLVPEAMSTGPISQATMARAVEDIRHDLGFPIKIVTDSKELPAEVARMPGVEDAAGIFYDNPFGGEVYLIQSNTSSEHSARVNAIHEVIGHHGLRGVLGENYARAMEAIRASFPEEVAAAAERNSIPLTEEAILEQNPNLTPEQVQHELTLNQRVAAEELVAYATEKVFGDKSVTAEQSVWKRILQFVRDTLRRLKLFSGLTPGDIETLIYRSRDYVRSNRAKRARALDALALKYGQKAYNPSYSPLMPGQQLSGMAKEVNVPARGRVSVGPNEVIRDAARRYMDRQGMRYEPPTSYLAVNEDRARRIAKAFDEMKHDPTDPKVKAAYDALVKETLAQYQALKETGLKVEFIEPNQDDPYADSPRLAIQDINENNHLWVFPTDSGFGSSEFDPKGNPLLQQTDEFIGDRRLLANDVFRIVHDYFGHAKEGVGFRADGEENAWRQHAAMYSPLARKAMTTETRGQNSWVNYGPYGEQNKTASGAATRYADQKIGLLPDEFTHLDEEVNDRLQSAFSVPPNLGKVGKFLTEDERALLKQKTAQKMLDIFKDLPSDAEMAAVALAGKAKRGWYKNSARAITNVFGPDAPRFTALLAALSPQTSVQSNLRNAIAVWAAWNRTGRPTSKKAIVQIMADNVEGDGGKNSVLPAWINNSVRALTHEDPVNLTLSGPKVNSFAQNLRGETNAVTLDTWMANYALVEQKLFRGAVRTDESGEQIGGKGPGYLAYTARVRQAAERLSKMTGETWTPAEVQETVWSWAKALTELTESYGQLATAREIIDNKELTDELINATPDFASLFSQEGEFRTGLENAGYGEQLGQLDREAARAGIEGQTPSPAQAAGQQKHLKSAATRIDKLIEQRREAEAETRRAAAFTLGGVQTNGDKRLESFLSKIGAQKKTLRQRWNDATSEILDRANMGMFDHFFGIKRAETLAGITAGESGYISARLAAGAGGLMRATLERGFPVWEGGAPNVKGEKGFFDIIKPLGDDVNTWLAWMVARRAERLHSEGREHLFTPEEIAAAKKLGDGNKLFEQAAREYAAFKGKVLDFAQEAGIINPETRAVWDNADHIPFYRLVENDSVTSPRAGGGLGYVKNQIRKLTGGEQNIGDPLENIMRNWSSMLEASLKAHAARLTVDNLNGTGLVTTAKIQPFTPEGIEQFKKNYPDLVKDLKSMGLDVDTLDPKVFQGIQSMLVYRAPVEEGTITVWRGGKKEAWNIHDPLLFRSLQAINPNAWGPWMKLFRAPKRLLTETVTLVPEFSVKNIWRDMWSVFIQGTNDKRAIPIIPFYDTAKGAVEFIKKGDVAHSLMAGGGSFEGTGFNDQTAAQAARRAAARGGIGNMIANSPMKLYLLYRDLLSAAENAHRVSVYNKAIAAGKSRKEALYEARDLMDFSLRGNSPVMRFLVETVPFLGARVAGLSTLGRRFKADPKGVALRGLLLVAATLAYVASRHDDDRYKGLTNDQKNLYWHFFDVFQKGDHIRVPKPFEVGTIFGTIPEVALDTHFSDEPDKYKAAAQVVGHAFGQALDLSPRIQAVWPVFELAINQNTFTGAPILNIGDQGVLPQDQDSPQVRPTWRMIARSMPEIAPDALKSPKQLQHLGQGYMGGLQDYVLAVTDKIARAEMGEPAPATKDAGDQLFFRSFYDVGPVRNTKYMNSLYNTADAAEKVYRSLNKAYDETRADQLITQQEDLLAVRKSYSKAVDQISALRKQQRQVQTSDMDPDEKKRTSDTIDESVNEIARAYWDLRPGGKLSPSVAAQMIGVSKQKQVEVLRKNGMSATAGLVESLPRVPPPQLQEEEQ